MVSNTKAVAVGIWAGATLVLCFQLLGMAWMAVAPTETVPAMALGVFALIVIAVALYGCYCIGVWLLELAE